MCSFLSKDSISSIVSATVILILFKVLSEAKFLAKEVLKLLNNINFVDTFRNPQIYIGTYKGSIILLNNTLDLYYLCYLILVIFIILGIAVNIYIFKKVF
ncbi:hypothetical protein [Clostridium cadaveris]